MQPPGPSIIREFESILATHCQKDFVIATCNASVGILGTFWSLGLQNKEVITIPLTWPGAITGLIALNCKVKFCNVEPDFLTIDPYEIKKLITPETKAVFSTDFLGYPCQLDKIKEVCEEYNLLLIHDAASSFGSYYRNRQSGFFADVSIYSFGSKKLFSLGEGGAIVTQKEDIYEKLLYGIAHPERQQMEYGFVNPFFLNVSMNSYAAENGSKVFEEKVTHIQKRAEEITDILAELNLNNEVYARPNYYKILINPNAIPFLHSQYHRHLCELPLGLLDRNCISSINFHDKRFDLDSLRKRVGGYKLLDLSFGS